MYMYVIFPQFHQSVNIFFVILHMYLFLLFMIKGDFRSYIEYGLDHVGHLKKYQDGECKLDSYDLIN